MNPYDVLGVRSDASDEEIGRAYKRLAKMYHPDLNPDDAFAAERMGQINRAYDDVKRIRQGDIPNGGDQPPYTNDYDPFYTSRTYYYSYRPRSSPMWMILGAVVMFFLIRLVFTLLFGGFMGSYYVSGIGQPQPDVMPGYGYYDYYADQP